MVIFGYPFLLQTLFFRNNYPIYFTKIVTNLICLFFFNENEDVALKKIHLQKSTIPELQECKRFTTINDFSSMISKKIIGSETEQNFSFITKALKKYKNWTIKRINKNWQ